MESMLSNVAEDYDTTRAQLAAQLIHGSTPLIDRLFDSQPRS